MSKILILVSSSGKNLDLGNEICQIGKEMELDVELVNLMGLKLPLYDSEKEKEGVPSCIHELVENINSSRALITVAPEYNGLIPPVLNNAISWISRSSDDWRDCFNGKVMAIATHSGGGGQYALMAMRQQFSYIGANVLGRQLLTNYSKPLNADSAREVFRQLQLLTSEE